MTLDKIHYEISKTENNEIILTENISKNKYLKKHKEVVLIETELTTSIGLVEVTLYVAVPEPIGVNLPKIYIDENSYKSMKYIPHINEDLSICIFDENENYKLELKKLPEITVNLIAKAKHILREGNSIKNLRNEFKREFSAYWNISYSKKKKNKEIGLCLIDFDDFFDLKAIRFHDKLAHFEYLVYNNEQDFNYFKEYLNFRKIKFTEIEVFIADYNNVIPPYNIDYNQSLSYLKDLDHFKNKANKLFQNNFLVVFKGDNNELYGWRYSNLQNRVEGFRRFSNWQFLNSSISKSKFVERLSFSNISPKRLDMRTSGIKVERNKNIAIIGLGSVGSNLLNSLTKLPISEYLLIDPDILKVENVFRHNFGFNYLSRYKTIISKNYILSKNPYTIVNTHEDDVCKVLIDDHNILENFDLRIVIVGLSRIEIHILKHLIAINSQKPILFIWVEPYLSSGQLVYVNPKDFEVAIKLIDNYPYHIIERGQNYLLKEGSCQTGYFPYSESKLNLFISEINYFLYELIVSKKEMESKVITWVGDLIELEEMDVKISSKYKMSDRFQLFEYKF